MKATGIVRRIDSSVIIGARVKALKTRGALDFCPISYIPRTVIRQPFFGNNAVQGGDYISKRRRCFREEPDAFCLFDDYSVSVPETAGDGVKRRIVTLSIVENGKL